MSRFIYVDNVACNPDYIEKIEPENLRNGKQGRIIWKNGHKQHIMDAVTHEYIPNVTGDYGLRIHQWIDPDTGPVLSRARLELIAWKLTISLMDGPDAEPYIEPVFDAFGSESDVCKVFVVRPDGSCYIHEGIACDTIDEAVDYFKESLAHAEARQKLPREEPRAIQ